MRPGQSVAVFGLGGIGLSAVLGAQLAGAHPIIGVDVNESKAATAKRAGATDFVVFDDQVVSTIRRLTGSAASTTRSSASGGQRRSRHPGRRRAAAATASCSVSAR